MLSISKLRILLFSTIFLSISSGNVKSLDIDKSFLKLPPGMEAAKIILDEKGYFHMQIDENNTYTFKLEFIDAKLRYIDLGTLCFELGMMWNFEDSETIFLASDILTEEDMKPFATKLHLYKGLAIEATLALQSKPVGAYLNIYKLKNNEYGMQICPKGERLDSSKSEYVVGIANLPTVIDHDNEADGYYVNEDEEEEKGFIESLIYDSLWGWWEE